jgi:ectoine hydroxylase-related dioxygenase (phytanoyl-CoA dioxygenase family)
MIVDWFRTRADHCARNLHFTWTSVFISACEPATFEKGTMSLLKGSHKCGTLPDKKVRMSANSATRPVPDGVECMVATLERIDSVANPGGAIYFHNDMIHTSNVNTSARPRIIGLIHIASIKRIPSVASWMGGKTRKHLAQCTVCYL